MVNKCHKTLNRPCRSQLAPLSLSLQPIQSICRTQGVNYSQTSPLTANPPSGDVQWYTLLTLNCLLSLNTDAAYRTQLKCAGCIFVIKEYKHPSVDFSCIILSGQFVSPSLRCVMQDWHVVDTEASRNESCFKL